MIIGLTGGTGAGKTTALLALGELGALMLDCDVIYHTLLAESAPLTAAIGRRFPEALEEGVLRRKKLGEIVFQNPAALAALNRITHGFVVEEVKSRLRADQEAGGSLAAIDAIALIESGLSALCDVVVGVTATPEHRIRRIIAREGIHPDYARKRIEAQQPDAFFQKHCDYVLENNGADAAAFQKECKVFFQALIASGRAE